jgi:AcrR family transcriptional regulator/acyl-CoA thioesterase FadM
VTRVGTRTDTRREELLSAAQRVIQRGGFASATISEITREAGASLGLVHYHFGSKDDVVAEAFEALSRADLRELEEIARRPEPPALRLAAYLDSSEWEDRTSWRMWIDAWGGAIHTDALRASLDGFARGWRATLAELLADGVRDGSWSCEDPADVAGRLVATLDGIGLHATLQPDVVPPERAAAWARRAAELELGVVLPQAPAFVPDPAPVPSHEVRLSIRGRDLDAGGRVHPAVHVAFLEEARAGWLTDRVPAAASAEFAVARVAMDLRRPLVPADGEVLVSCALDHLGRSSIRTRETIETDGRALVTNATTTLVARDARTGRPRPLTADERSALAR